MLSLIEVKCPHCGAHGQIMVPPVGAIIVGPCPQCNELVVVFCGFVLALDKHLMETGSTEQRREHLLEVLSEFLKDRIAKLLSDDNEIDSFGEAEPEPFDENEDVENPRENRGPISENAQNKFRDVDLKLLDQAGYFKAVFGKKENPPRKD